MARKSCTLVRWAKRASVSICGPRARASAFRHRHSDHDAVRVADAHAGAEQPAPAKVHALAHDLAPRPSDADDRAVEAGLPHPHADRARAGRDSSLGQAALGFDHETRFRDAPGVPEIASKDAQPVAALLGLAAVGVDDAKREIGAFARQGADQQAITADAQHAMAESGSEPGQLRKLQRSAVQDQVVVA
jgi:hypothetical protein